jgi:ubiquitin-protein ligase
MREGWRGEKWSRTLEKLTTHLSPANVEAAQLYKDNVKEYERKVKVSDPSAGGAICF